MCGAVSRIAGKNLLLALFDIAYRSRLGLPLLVSAGLMLFDVQFRIEVGFEVGVEEAIADHEEAEAGGVDGEEGDVRMRHPAQEQE